MTSRDEIVRIEALSFQYPRSPRLALSEVNLSIRKGEIIALVGPTGAGKSTLCMTMNGTVPQFFGGRFFGRVSVAGLDTCDTPIAELAQQVAIVFQDPETQLLTNSVELEVAFALENLRVPRAEIERRIQWALHAVRLEGLEKRHPSDLSGGEKQRLAIAAALACRPEILVLDEPTSQLDPVGAQEVFTIVRDLNRQLGMTVVLASHASEELAELAHRIVILAEGHLADVGIPEKVFTRSDLLDRFAIRPPQVAQFYQLLRAKGVPTQCVPVTLDAGKREYERLRSRLSVRSFPPQPALGRRNEVLIRAELVSYNYPSGTQALKNVSLEIHEGEYIMVAGQNGAGKTTLLKLLMRLLEPKTGSVSLAGRSLGELRVSDVARRIGFVSQNPDNQIFNDTVEAEVSLALPYIGLRGLEAQRRVDESLDEMDLSDVRLVHPLSLPRGDRARLVIAAVLATHPDALFFDEPTTGQDYLGARRILDISRQLHQTGKTVVVVTHHLHLMPDYAERAVLMGKGIVLLDAPLRQTFYEDSLLRSTFLAAPQIVEFARYVSEREGLALPVLTPEELAGCVVPLAGTS